MLAAVLTAVRELTVMEVPAPRAGAGEVVVEVVVNALCGSDVHAFQGNHPRVGVGGWFGHELAGLVAAVGADVSRAAVGDRVAVDSVLPCHGCAQCRSGHTNRCSHYLTTGSRGDGGLAELVRVPEANVHPIPPEVSFEVAALVQPLAIAHHSVHRVARVRAGEVVSVVGAGPVGLFVLVLCRQLGASVVVSDPHPARRARAEELGAAWAVGAGSEVVLAALEELGSPGGSAHTFDCVGGAGSAVLATCARVTAPGGSLTILGTYSGDTLPLPNRDLAMKEVLVRSSRSYTTTSYADSLRLVVEGTVPMPDLVTHRFPLDRAQEALERLDSGDPAVVKAVVYPRERAEP